MALTTAFSSAAWPRWRGVALVLASRRLSFLGVRAAVAACHACRGARQPQPVGGAACSAIRGGPHRTWRAGRGKGARAANTQATLAERGRV
eukprot:1949032-Prymnesium_polylepis.1